MRCLGFLLEDRRAFTTKDTKYHEGFDAQVPGWLLLDDQDRGITNRMAELQ
jgi:hypothetical protein